MVKRRHQGKVTHNYRPAENSQEQCQNCRSFCFRKMQTATGYVNGYRCEEMGIKPGVHYRIKSNHVCDLFPKINAPAEPVVDQARVNSFIHTSVDDCRTRLNYESDLVLLEELKRQCADLGHKTREKVVAARIRKLQKLRKAG